MAQQPAGNGLSYTIVPFNDISKLPACANACGPLWDANGACVPPALPTADASTYESCFCADSRIAPFSTGGGANVCPNACPGNPQGLSSIGNWFTSFCNGKAPKNTPQTTGTNTAAETNAAGSSGSNNGGSNSGNGGDWLSNHWQWVIMLVILVVGIAGIWIGACIWRRRYLRKKDRQTSLGQKHSGSASHPSWGPAVTGTETATPTAQNAGRDPERGVATEKAGKTQPKKKWTVTQRT
ncbi:integral membrane protein [Metarhizium guizhouense ARSEF 977]|uniref:Integral membrane protein n=1 Tax=Metarhizium guizhouense (strain ARSEF 977) TaxID=1276136 RepID=A0A0B4I212_METGA|nr:integral membrane protein [Metarhizium guizhouense ARSEF 977]